MIQIVLDVFILWASKVCGEFGGPMSMSGWFENSSGFVCA
jgi:hypothetical protein